MSVDNNWTRIGTGQAESLRKKKGTLRGSAWKHKLMSRGIKQRGPLTSTEICFRTRRFAAAEWNLLEMSLFVGQLQWHLEEQVADDKGREDQASDNVDWNAALRDLCSLLTRPLGCVR